MIPKTKPAIAMIAVLAGVFFAADDQTVVVTILPQIMGDLRIGVTEIDTAIWTITAYLLGYVSVMPIMGRLSDIFGRRKIYGIAMCIFMLGSMGTAITGSLDWINDTNIGNNTAIEPIISTLVDSTATIQWVILTRVIQAIGAGALVPVSIAIVSDLYPNHRRGLPIGLTGASAEAGAVIGPLWGAIISTLFNWQWVFWINIPISMIVLIGILITIPKQPRNNDNANGIDYIGAIMLAATITLFTLGCSQIGDISLATIAMFTGGILCTTVYIFHSYRSQNPIIPKILFKSTTFLSSNIVHILYGAALIINMVTVPLMANTVFQMTPLQSGLLLSNLTIAIPIGAITGGVICKWTDYRIISIPTLIVCSFSLFLMSQWDRETKDIYMFIHLLIAGGCFGILISPIILSAINSTLPSMSGAASGLITTSRFLGMTIGLAAMASWGSSKFEHLLSGVTLPINSGAKQSSQALSDFESSITNIGTQLFNDFFMTAAVLCLIALIPCILVKNDKVSS